MDINYSRVCNHPRLSRINNNFVRCLNCGQSMISQQIVPINKSRRDFSTENKSFVRNFDRNFSNVLEEIDTEIKTPMYEYYMDRNWNNIVIINRSVQFHSSPPKFEVEINGQSYYLTDEQIKKILVDINAIKIPEEQFNHIRKKLNDK